MNEAALDDAALVVLGHGTDLNDQSALPVRQHAAELRRRGLFREVHEAFWKQDPRILEMLAQISAPRVFIVPLFISDGYFAGELIPQALGFAALPAGIPRNESRIEPLNGPFTNSGVMVRRAGSQTTFYCQPVGTHKSMTGIILSRAAGIARQFPFPRAPKPPETTLFIAGHGTEKSGRSRLAIDRQVELIRAQGLYASVQAVYMEEEPRIAGCPSLARTRNCIVVPFFISDGLHVTEDIPVLLGENAAVVKARLSAGQPPWRNPTEIQGKRFWYSASVGTDPGLADVILERVREAAAGLPTPVDAG